MIMKLTVTDGKEILINRSLSQVQLEAIVELLEPPKDKETHELTGLYGEHHILPKKSMKLHSIVDDLGAYLIVDGETVHVHVGDYIGDILVEEISEYNNSVWFTLDNEHDMYVSDDTTVVFGKGHASGWTYVGFLGENYLDDELV